MLNAVHVNPLKSQDIKMKTNKYPVFLSLIFFSFVSTSYADVFGTDDKKWERVFSDLKKISIRLTDNVDVQLKSLQTSQAELLRVIDGLKSTIPALQGAIEQNDANMTQQLSKLESRLAELEGRTRSQLAELEGKTKVHLDEQKKSQTDTANALKQALAVDMENLAKQNLASLQTLSKSSSDSLAAINSGFAAANSGFMNIDNNNKKMIDILAKTLQENQETGKTVGSVSKKMGEVNDHIIVTRDTVAKLKEIINAKDGAQQARNEQISKNIDKLAELLKGLQTQNTTLSTSLTASLQQVDEKVTQSMLKIDPTNANLDLANQKLSKLIEILKAFAGDQEKIVKSQQSISDSLRDFAGEQERMAKKQQAISETLNEMRAKGDSSEPKKSSKSQKKSEGRPKKSTNED